MIGIKRSPVDAVPYRGQDGRWWDAWDNVYFPAKHRRWRDGYVWPKRESKIWRGLRRIIEAPYQGFRRDREIEGRGYRAGDHGRCLY